MIIVGGATATGKSHLAIELAKRLGGELISADSMQIYKGMDIGTAKETGDIGVKQHLIDVVNPDEPFTVVDFKNLALEKISEIRSRGNIPIIVGGTGLYMDSLLYKMEYGGGATENLELKASLELELAEKGAEYMHARLKELDPISADKYHYNNTIRVIRALYVVLNTGKRISDQSAEFCPVEPVTMFITKRNRDLLRKRITLRIDQMIEEGLEAEVKSLLDKGYGFDLQSMLAIGYKEWKGYFEGEQTIDEVKEQIDINTRQYAKRQDTWFNNRYKEIAHFVDMQKPLDQVVDELLKDYISILK